jgi:nucleoside-diphosphate-sugar epimerase/2-polyprenyl-3-methyl-5-hydroxy-6-metoxy-1,4-benzoquinol methylase
MIQIALIGSCGYVGTMIYDYFQGKDGIQIDCYDIATADVYPPHFVKNVKELTQEDVSRYDVFIYVAGLSRKEDCEKSDYVDVYKANVEDALHIPTLMSESQLFLFSSTGSLYSSDNKDDVCSEDYTIDSSRFEKYEQSMLSREAQIQKLQKRCIALRFGTVIGISKNMRPELLHNGIFNSGFSSSKFNIWNGNARRAILYSEDLVNCLDRFIQQRDTFSSFDVYNLVSFNTSILETAETISKRMNWPFTVIKNINSVGFYMDNTKVCQKLGYTFVGSNEYICDVYSKRKDELVALFSNPQNRFVKCIICRSIRLESILDLGNQPLANSYLLQKEGCNKYPLHLFRCMNCFHTQLDYFVDREVLFKNYQYESGTSFTLRKYFSDLAQHYTEVFKDVPDKTVLELACNDGFQLDEFKERGWKTYGVDPAENLVKRGISRGHTIEAKFWAKEDIACIKDVSFNLIVAENVLAHVNNPINFLMKCESVMNDDTLLVIQTSQANMYFNNEFDTIYHEHISFFTIRSMMRAVNSVGCHLVNVYKTPIHGTSYVFEIKKGLKTVDLPLLKEEEALGLYTNDLYTKYQQNVKDIKTYTLNMLRGYKDRGYSILAFGAAAKGCVFLNYLFDSSEHELAPEHVIDESPLKLNKFLSGTLIHVAGMNILEEYTNKKVVMIILAWNFSTEILTKLQSRIKDMPFESFEAVSFLPNTNVQTLI